MNKKIVVIGTSAFGMAVLAKLRSFDTASDIVCISAEPYKPYNRCHIASFLTGEKELADISLQGPDFFEKHQIAFYPGLKVTSIDRVNKIVQTISGQRFEYDKLFLGIGCVPIMLPFGQGFGNVVTFHTLADIYHLQGLMARYKPKKAVVVGAGINGIEAAHALQMLGLQVVVVDQAERIMPFHVMAEVGNVIQQQAQKVGISFMLGKAVAGFVTDLAGAVSQVLFSDQNSIFTDLVVVAIGVKPNISLVAQAGLECVQGAMQVNEALQTSDPDVYAGGDSVMTVDMVTGLPIKSATWADAMLAGLCAATQMSDRPRLYPGALGLRDSVFFGRPFYACGVTVDLSNVQIITKSGDDFDHWFYLKEERLVGFVLFGNIEYIGLYKQFYVTKRSVTAADF